MTHIPEDDCLACREYNELSRRQFLTDSGTAVGLGAFASFVPAWLPKVVFAESYVASRDVIVSIFLRGGADGLSLCAPWADPAYYAARATIAIPQPDGTNARKGIALDDAWAFPQALSTLMPAFRAGQLLVVHATGLTTVTRSHFDAQRYMEVGKAQDPSLNTGWLGRHLASVPPMRTGASLRAIGISDGLQKTLYGAPQALPISDPANFNISGAATTRTERTEFLKANFARSVDPVKSAATDALNTLAMLRAIDFNGYRPAAGATYPANSNFARGLRSAAALIKADVGVEAIQIDLSGWDTHSAQDPLAGSMFRTMTDLATGLSAFHADVIGSGITQNVTIVVLSEFGRNVRQNTAAGTDHGRGTVAMLMGRNITGGRVLTHNWPGLDRANLEAGQDLKVTLDYRDLLAEVVQNRLGNPNLGVVFPDYTPVLRGVTK
jgi:uncharacterized protein (DUF1501 family)